MNVSDLSELKSRLSELKAEWNSAQPLAADANDKLWRKLRLEWNYHSNHIEGNTLTYGETELLLIQGKTTGQHDLREYEEMKAHDVAIDYVKQLAAGDRPLTEGNVRELNQILLKEPFWKEAITADGQPTKKQITPGQYKTQPNNVKTITGAIFPFAPPESVPSQMAELISWFREHLEKQDTDIVPLLTSFHHRFSVIHPFDDGNGRTMRLLVNYALLRKSYVPIVISSVRKKEYIGVLGAADAGELRPFAIFMGERICEALELGLRASRNESLEEPEDWQKEMSLFAREFAAEGDPAPPKDPRLLYFTLQNSVNAIIQGVFEHIQPLKKLFHSINCRLTFLRDNQQYAPRKWDETGSNHIANMWPLTALTLEFLFEGFSNSGVKPFDVSAHLKLDLAIYRYSIASDGFMTQINGLRYDRPLANEQVTAISGNIARHLFNLVKINAEKNSI